MAIDPLAPLATFAAIIALGFLGYLLFERTRVTDVLILMAFGLLVGPGLGIFDVSGFQEASALVGTLALIVIMFDGGLGMSFSEFLSGLGRAAALALIGFALTVGAIAAVGHELLGLPWMHAALLGTILGGTSGIVIMPIMARTMAHPSTRVLLNVESALTDVLCVIGSFTIIGILAHGNGAALDAGQIQGSLQTVAANFSVAIVLGLILGLLWLRLLKTLESRKYSYMLTLAAVLGLYVGTEVVGGNGAIATLIFGLVLGNGRLIARKFDIQGLQFSESQRQFQGELAFLVRVFFFVYLGVILDPTVFLNPAFLVAGGALVLAIVVSRLAATGVALWGDAETKGDRMLTTFLLPRGLAATVLAGLPAQAGIAGTEGYLSYAFVVVAVTNLVGTAAVLLHERRIRRRARAPSRPAEGVAAAGR
jgi:cell volume regulation protein A